ncbi:MAG: CYTH domain-containing protein [Candidatus Paceibacterota bacterium]
MKIETEIKLMLINIDIKKLLEQIEEIFDLEKNNEFLQITHQFFFEDYTKQIAFPRIRNEEDGRNTLTLKVKEGNISKSEYFKRIELDTDISDVDAVIKMMPYFGYPKKISWEKKRINFLPNKNAKTDFEISLDETPMGYFLEIEADENRIEEIIKLLKLEDAERTKKAYLGIWADFKEKHNIKDENMLFEAGKF